MFYERLFLCRFAGPSRDRRSSGLGGLQSKFLRTLEQNLLLLRRHSGMKPLNALTR